MRKYFSAFRSPYVARNHRDSSRQDPAQAGFCLWGVARTEAGARGIHTVPLTALSLIGALSYHVRMRYLVTLFLGALLVIVGGLSLDYFSLDFSAPEDGQLTASGRLAYYDCYF